MTARRGRPRKDAQDSDPWRITNDNGQRATDFIFTMDSQGRPSTEVLEASQPQQPPPSDKARPPSPSLIDDYVSADFEDNWVDPLPQAGDQVPGRDDNEEDESEADDQPQNDTGKRKKRAADDPMREWRPWIRTFLSESLRLHGRGYDYGSWQCDTCGVTCVSAEGNKESGAAKDANETTPNANEMTPDANETTKEPYPSVAELYRCRTCGCFYECADCCLKRHQRTPLHKIEVWRSGCWERVTLRTLGLVYQLNHAGGVCILPDPTPRLLTITDVTGIHVVDCRLCRCDRSLDIHPWQQLYRDGWYPSTTRIPQSAVTMEVLDLYRRLKVVGTLNVRDFVTCLEDMSDPWGTDPPPDRYKVFGRVARQDAFLARVRRSGVAHTPGQLSTARTGSLIVKCWACPRIGVNLPHGWESSPKEQQYLYRTTLSVDANFRMVCRMRQSSRTDPPLYPGLGVQMPDELYHNWLRKYITEEDVSSCISFAALMQKDTKFTTGLRWAGVVGVICARHELMLGLGDLEKGERYKNTDFVLYWVLSHMSADLVAVTYDIACQYSKHFRRRITQLQEYIRAQLAALPAEIRALNHPNLREPTLAEIIWALPIWHGNVHEVDCKTDNSVKYQPGLGKTDGEGIERVWSIMNPMSYITREEQPGARHDDHEDLLNRASFKKNTNQGLTLSKRLRIALLEKKVQVDAFEEISATLTPELREEWLKKVRDWEEDHSKANPFRPPGKDNLTEAQVRAELHTTELKEMEHLLRNAMDGTDSEVDVNSTSKGSSQKTRRTKPITMGAFLVMGLQLEEAQRKLVISKSAAVTITPNQDVKIRERRVAWWEKLNHFRRHQNRLMPGVADLLEWEEEQRREKQLRQSGENAEKNMREVEAEDIKLYLPSACDADANDLCPPELRQKEASLRRGQCSDSLIHLRTRLIARRHLINFRNANVTGQRQTTRSASCIQLISEKIREASSKYRRAREALVALVGEESIGPFRPLLDEDIELFAPGESDSLAVKKLGRLSGRDSRVTASGRKSDKVGEGSTRQKVSWIWTAGGDPGEDDEFLHESVRVEWSKALARRDRWNEEVELLKEEMRRVLRSLKWEEREWRAKADMPKQDSETQALSDGRIAYALKQAEGRRSVRLSFEELWLRKEPSRGQKAGPMDALAQAAAAAIIAESQ